jgi:hypothetical protein
LEKGVEVENINSNELPKETMLKYESEVSLSIKELKLAFNIYILSPPIDPERSTRNKNSIFAPDILLAAIVRSKPGKKVIYEAY